MSDEVDYETLRKYHVSRTNILKIVKYMKYEVPDNPNSINPSSKQLKSGMHISLEDFVEKYSEFNLIDMKEDMTMIINEKEENSLLLKWHPQYKLGVSVADTADFMCNNGLKKAIIVADGGLTSTTGCNDILQNLKITKKITINVWRLDESMIFVPNHVLVPFHRICTLKERKALFKVCGIKSKDDMPNIQKDDIMVRYLGANKGQVIETNERSITNPDCFILHYMIVV
jgi:DNA-directed RNA polymerase subunit H (RpoH/RPB5)